MSHKLGSSATSLVSAEVEDGELVPHWRDSVSRVLPKRGHVRFVDGLVGVDTPDRKFVMTSPNVAWVPAPIYSNISVKLRADGQFGVEDPLQWPQLFPTNPGCFHLAAIRRRPHGVSSPSHKFYYIFANVTIEDFVPINTDESRYGTLSVCWQEGLKDLMKIVDDRLTRYQAYTKAAPPDTICFLVTSMRDVAFVRLDFPSTFRDIRLQTVSCQRLWLEATAWLDWATILWPAFKAGLRLDQPVPAAKEMYMGAYTADVNVVQNLAAAGLPVWLLRVPAELSKEVVVLQEASTVIFPSHINTEIGDFAIDPIFMGKAPDHLPYTSRNTHFYHDTYTIHTLNSEPCPWNIPDVFHHPKHHFSGSRSESRPAPNHTKGKWKKKVKKAARNDKQSICMQPASHVGRKPHPHQREAYADPSHPWIPPVIPEWSHALLAIDLSISPVNHWLYWLPHPTLIVGSKTEENQILSLTTWLQIRQGWLSVLKNRPYSIQPVSAQHWRVCLQAGKHMSTGDTHTAVFMRETFELFSAILGDNHLNNNEPITFFGHEFTNPPPDICPFILWEIYEVGFRVDLVELDRYQTPGCEEATRATLLGKVFPGREFLHTTALPIRNEGLAAVFLSARVPALEALRSVMIRWKDVPPSFLQIPPLPSVRASASNLLAQHESSIINTYTQIFHRCAGRAPFVPHRIPTTLLV